MTQNRSNRARLAALLLMLAVLAAGWWQRFAIYDWWRLRSYQPPAEIVRLADDTTMTDYGRRLFYVAHPQLNDRQSFSDNCTISEASIVLGCYVTADGIYIFDVEDERLAGVEQVTAAHEMLHVAYDRLDDTQRQRIDELTSELLIGLNNERLARTIDSYRQRDPAVVPNELHSIVATEITDIGPELEDYYRQYFTDRHKVVQYSQAYEGALEERRRQIEAYDSRLTQLKALIDTNSTRLDAQEAWLRADRAELDSLLASRQYEAYNARVPAYNAAVRDYNSLIAATRDLINSYNQLIEQRNALALEESELLEALDSRPTIAPAE